MVDRRSTSRQLRDISKMTAAQLHRATSGITEKTWLNEYLL